MNIYFYLLIICYMNPFSMKCDEPFWQYLDKFTDTDVADIAFNKNGDIYCGGLDLYKSYDDGLTWIFLGFNSLGISQIIIDDIGYIYIDNNGRLYISKDDGHTWDNITYKLGWHVNGDFFINKRGYVFIGQFFTKDHGDSFLYDTSGIGGYYSYAMNSEGHIFRGGLGSQETICRSTDDGDTWEVVWVDPKEDWPYRAVCEEVKHMLFSQTDSVGYACGYKTLNNGRSWYINDYFKESSAFIQTLDSLGFMYSFRSAYSNYAYYKKIFKRIKDSTWVEVDTSGLNGVDEFNTMATSPNGYLYLSAHNGGLYRSRQAYVSAPDTPPAEHSDLSVSPNPASDYIDINLERCATSSRCGTSGLRIYNSLGVCVLPPLAFGEGPGVRLDISNFPIGLYFISINNGKKMLTGSFIVMR